MAHLKQGRDRGQPGVQVPRGGYILDNEKSIINFTKSPPAFYYHHVPVILNNARVTVLSKKMFGLISK